MATRNPNEEPEAQQNSKNALLILTVGCLVVAGLVVWALTRTVEPAPETATATTQEPLRPISVTDTVTTPPAVATDTTSPVQISVNGGPPLTVPTTNTPPPLPTALQQQQSNDQVRRIAAEDVRDKIRAGSAIIVDVRDAASFATGHIPGAINMPFASVQTQLASLPKGREIITYCT